MRNGEWGWGEKSIGLKSIGLKSIGFLHGTKVYRIKLYRIFAWGQKSIGSNSIGFSHGEANELQHTPFARSNLSHQLLNQHIFLWFPWTFHKSWIQHLLPSEQALLVTLARTECMDSDALPTLRIEQFHRLAQQLILLRRPEHTEQSTAQQ